MTEPGKIGTTKPDTSRTNPSPQQQSMLPGPTSSVLNTVSSPVAFHHAIGNQAVQRLFSPGAIQPKLTIGKPDDRYEQEADRVADQVMRMSDKGGSASRSLIGISPVGNGNALSALQLKPG